MSEPGVPPPTPERGSPSPRLAAAQPPSARPATTGPPAAAPRGRGSDDWRLLLAVFFVTSLVEGFGVSQIFAFMPQYLTQMGVPEQDRLAFVGLFSSLIFIVGAPLVPLWGVWADKYSRKTVIIRSALVEATVLVAVALSQEPWQLALSLLLVGFQLGNTGVMLSAIRDVVPRRRLGAAIGLFGASGPIGMSLGPVVGGILVDGLGFSLSQVFLSSALLSLSTAGLLALTHEIRPEVVPQGRVIALAFGAVRSVIVDPVVRRIFAIYFVAFLAAQMTRPYTPVLVEGIVGPGPGLTSAVGLVAGTAALVGALAAPIGGVLGDRLGFQRILLASLGGGAITLALVPLAATLSTLALAVLLFIAFNAIVGPMVFGLLATEVPSERRSATLNLVYLPLYAAGIVGPAIGAVAATAVGPGAPYFVGAIALAVGTLAMAATMRGSHARPAPA
jgi:DHA1 family multidrug resistance protein-like MFS transporter